VEQAKRNTARRDGLNQLNRNRHQAETDRPAPHSLNSHFIPPKVMQSKKAEVRIKKTS
jgi:hypothetical protein